MKHQSRSKKGPAALVRPSAASLFLPEGDELPFELFATRYKLVLPTEEELRLELIREQRLLEEHPDAPAGRPAKKKRRSRNK